MASQFPTPADHMNTFTTQSVPSTLHGATIQTAERNEFNNPARDANKITIQNFIIDHRMAAAPESERTSGGTMIGTGNVEDSEDLQPVSDPVGNSGIYSTLSYVLGAIFRRRDIRSSLVVGNSACSDGSNLLPREVITDQAPSHCLEPVATVTDIAANESFSSSPNISTERYTRLMLNCQCAAGYPLYEPRPDCDPSTEYWKKGVRIGDVGIVTEDGIFDFIFNVCPSQNPLINPSQLPDDFEALECPEIRVMERHFKMQTHLFNSAVNRIEEPDVRYKCLGPEGAILELPAGATLFEAKNKLSFKSLASRHAEKWYKYTIVTRRRDTPNGSLYLVTSCIKCTHWGIAVFDRPSASQDYLQFIENEVLTTTNRDSRSKYDWRGPGSFIAKVAIDIPDSSVDDGTNQCIFLRGYKIMLRKDVWENAIDPHSSGTPYISTSSMSPNSGSKRTRQGDFSNQNDHLDEGGLESSGGTSRVPGQITYECEIKPTDADTLLTTMGTERVIIRADFNTSPLHPSDLVNIVLLSQEPDAKIVLTHDDDWWDLLRDYEDLGKIALSYTSVIDEYGSASLELVGDRSGSDRNIPSTSATRGSSHKREKPQAKNVTRSSPTTSSVMSSPNGAFVPGNPAQVHRGDRLVLASPKAESLTQLAGRTNPPVIRDQSSGRTSTFSVATTSKHSAMPSLSTTAFRDYTPGNISNTELIISGRDTIYNVENNYIIGVFPNVIDFIRVASRYLVALTRKAGGKARNPVEISDIVPPDPSSLPVSSIADRYTRSMLECMIGYPLYEPQPFSELSKEYEREGVHVGDVGFVRADGTFDFLFNICSTQNGSLNPPNLPDGFCLREHLNTRTIRPLSAKTCLFPSTVTKMKSGEYVCKGPEGAILVLPEGAIRDEAINIRRFEELAKLRGVEWYAHTLAQGRSISNGSLYLITSFTKCTQWGIAVFDRPCEPGQALRFVSNPLGWRDVGASITKVADPNKGDTPNQCVFLRGYKIMIRQDIFNKIPKRQRAQRLKGGGGPDLLSRILPGGNHSTRTKTDKAVLHANVSESSLVHPSDLINAELLSQNPKAEVALTHDDVWCDLLWNKFPTLTFAGLYTIAQSFTSTVDENGCVSLEK